MTDLARSVQLAQIRPANTSTNVAYTADITTEITLIKICNTTALMANFSLYHDDFGSSFNNDTALYLNHVVGANDTKVIELKHAGGGISISPGGSVGIQSSVSGAINFTMYGKTTDVTGV